MAVMSWQHVHDAHSLHRTQRVNTMADSSQTAAEQKPEIEQSSAAKTEGADSSNAIPRRRKRRSGWDNPVDEQQAKKVARKSKLRILDHD